MKSPKHLVRKQKAFIKAFKLGFTYPEIFAMLGINAGHFSSWKRWRPEFKEAMRNVQMEGLANRRMAATIKSLESRFGAKLTLDPPFQRLKKARAIVPMRADGYPREHKSEKCT